MDPELVRFLYPLVATANTTRIGAVDDIGTAIALSRFGFVHGSNTVILAPENQPALSAAASTLVHFPLDGPVLLNPVGSLDQRVRQEIVRLAPAGEGSPAQVFLVGPFSPAVQAAIQSLGLTVQRVGSSDPIQTAVAAAEIRLSVEATRNVTLVSLDDLVWGILAAGWTAHMGDPLLYVHANSIPPATAQFIRNHQPNVYLMGPPAVISRAVLDQVRSLTSGYVARIIGFSPAEVAVNFSRFFAPTNSLYGWGRWSPNSGQAFSFLSTNFTHLDLVAPAGSCLSHIGKHTPLLYVEPNSVPDATRDYLMSVNPGPFLVQEEPPFMHGFVVGNQDVIALHVQLELNDLLTRGEHMPMSAN